MDAGILRALKTVKDNRYVQYAGLGLANLVQQEDQIDKETGKRKRKSKYQLIRISAAVCGIELCYAAETAFVSPILLKLGVPPSLMTMVWCLSPIVGFFLVPIMGSLSDRCRLRIGRRRPFIMILSLGIIFGLAVVPNGQILGVFLGDTWNKSPFPPPQEPPPSSPSPPQSTTTATTVFPQRSYLYSPNEPHNTPLITTSALPKPNSILKSLETNNNNISNNKQFSNASYSSLLSKILSSSLSLSSSSSSSTRSPLSLSSSLTSSSSLSLDLYDDIDLPTQQQQQQQQQMPQQLQSQLQQSQSELGNYYNSKSNKTLRRNSFMWTASTTTTTTATAVTTTTTPGINSVGEQNRTLDDRPLVSFSVPSEHLKGIILTILGVALLDFNCDACQSPCRAYLLDVSVPEDHSQGLTMFTVMAGAGGAVGYVMGGIDWNATGFGEAFGGHIRVVFTLVLVAFVVCVTSTLTSFKEIPLSELKHLKAETMQKKKKRKDKKKYRKFTNEEDESEEENDDDEGEEVAEFETATSASMKTNYGALSDTGKPNQIFVSNINETRKFTPEFRQFHSQNTTPSSGVSTKEFNADSERESRYLHNGEKAHVISTGISENDGNRISPRGLEKNFSSSTGCNDETPISDTSISKTSNDRRVQNGVQRNGQIRGQTNAQLTTESSVDSDFPKEISPYTMRCDINDKDDHAMTAINILEVSTDVTLKTYLRSIVRMPRCMWVLCLTNLFCWMSLVCYSLYFTDFVGQAVFQGNPQSPVGSLKHNLYDEGIRLGSMGMSLYSLSCACYSLIIEKLVQRFRAKRVYVIGQLVYTVGMLVMSVSRSKVAVILMSPTAGVMYATLFTMPYLLVAHYHARGMFSQSDKAGGEERQVRGLGTDVAIISSMVFLAQFLLSVCMGTFVSVLRSTTTVVVASSILSLMGAITATQVTYLDL